MRLAPARRNRSACSLGVEEPRRGGGEGPLVGEDALHQHGRRQRGPDLADRRVQRGVGAHLRVEGGRRGGVLPARVRVAQPGEPPHPGAEGVATDGEGHVASGDLVHGLGEARRRDAQPAPRRAHPEILVGHLDELPGRVSEHRRHAGVALEPGHLGRVGSQHPAAHQALDRRLAGGRLAEGRQHLRDVAEEERVRPDDQHALLVELLPVLEQQEGGPVEPDGGLAGARTALHHEAGVDRRRGSPRPARRRWWRRCRASRRCASAPARRAADRGCPRGGRRRRCRGRRTPRRTGRRPGARSSGTGGGAAAPSGRRRWPGRTAWTPGARQSTTTGSPRSSSTCRRPTYQVSPSSASRRPKVRPSTSVSSVRSRACRCAWAMAESTACAADSVIGGGLLRALAHAGEVGVGPVEVGLLDGELGVVGHRAPGDARRHPRPCVDGGVLGEGIVPDVAGSVRRHGPRSTVPLRHPAQQRHLRGGLGGAWPARPRTSATTRCSCPTTSATSWRRCRRSWPPPTPPPS